MFKNLLNWLKARASEKSTYVGVLVIAGAVFPPFAPIAKVAISVLGGALIGATTTPAAPSDASAVGTGA